MATVTPIRPFQNAIAQAQPAARQSCVRAVLCELREGRNGFAIAGQLQMARLQQKAATPSGGAA